MMQHIKEMSMNLTKKQKIMLDFIEGFTQTSGYSPTFREIMQALDYKSVATVAKHVDNLVVLGYLRKRDGEARSIEIVSGSDDRPWWSEIEREIKKRESSDDDELAKEAEILRQALEILRKNDR